MDNQRQRKQIYHLPDELILQMFVKYFSVDDWLNTLRHVQPKWNSLIKIACRSSIRKLELSTHRPFQMIVGFSNDFPSQETSKFEQHLWRKFQTNFYDLLEYCNDNLRCLKLTIGTTIFGREAILRSMEHCQCLETLEIVGCPGLHAKSLRQLNPNFYFLKTLKIVENHAITSGDSSEDWNGDDYEPIDTIAQLILCQNCGPLNLKKFSWSFSTYHKTSCIESVLFALAEKSVESMVSLEIEGHLTNPFNAKRLDRIFEKLKLAPNLNIFGFGFKFDGRPDQSDDENEDAGCGPEPKCGPEGVWLEIFAQHSMSGFYSLMDLTLNHLNFGICHVFKTDILGEDGKNVTVSKFPSIGQLPNLKRVCIFKANLYGARIAAVIHELCPTLTCLEIRKSHYSLQELIQMMYNTLHPCSSFYRPHATKCSFSSPIIEILVDDYTGQRENVGTILDFCGVNLEIVPEINGHIYSLQRFTCTK